VLLAIAERQTAYLLSNSPTVAALVDLLLHCTLTGSLATVETIVNGWLTIAEFAVDAQQRQQLRPLIEHSLSACLQRCLRVKSSGCRREMATLTTAMTTTTTTTTTTTVTATTRMTKQLRSLRARVAELLCVSQMFIGVENMLNVLVELSASSSAGREAAWALLPGVAPALSAAQPRNIARAAERRCPGDRVAARCRYATGGAQRRARQRADCCAATHSFRQLPQPILAADPLAAGRREYASPAARGSRLGGGGSVCAL
jgi:hypothetical protein